MKIIPGLMISIGFYFLLIPMIYLDPYEEMGPGWYVLSGIFLTTALIAFIVTYRQTLERVLSKVQTLSKSRVIVSLITLFVFQIALASICYWIYYKNPKLYVIGDEIEKRYVEMTKTKTENELNDIEKFKSNVRTDLELLKYLSEVEKSFVSSSDGQLLVNDSLYIAIELHKEVPGGEPVEVMKIYTKWNLSKIATFYSEKEIFKIVIQNQIKKLERKASLIQDDLNEISIKSNDYKWSYIHFLSYYFRQQVQPMSLFLIIFDFVKIFVWVVMGSLFTIPLLKPKTSVSE